MSVAGPYAATRHQSPTRPSKSKHPRPSGYQTVVVPPQSSDPYYGHREIAELCLRFIKSLFACPDRPPPSTTSPSSPTPTLAIFVAYALHRTRLHQSVTFTALFLLSRLKSRFPAARGSSGHRLFISAFMIASKVVCDDTYSNKSWTVVGQGMFSLREINQMEREMCGYLEWVLNVDPKELVEFEETVRKDYAVDGACPSFVHPAQPAAAPVPASTINASQNPLQSSTVSSHHAAPPPPPPTYVDITHAIDARPSTPALGDNNSPSPASSTACVTPQSDEETDDATIVTMGLHDEHMAEMGPMRAHSAMSMSSVASMPPKSKLGRDPSFAFVSRTVW
ncbi:hypothetical protein BU17DRAFT_74392 [Hysterangium stoloniferum]|nr:hypothetical protein BU17DRAFT_74392 [Hysterangium stoloniferum]